MKKINSFETGGIDLNALLSTRTYFNAFGFDICVYCHSEIESEEWNLFRDNQNISHWVSKTICKCEKAQEELALKKEFLNKFSLLDEYIDENKINSEILKSKIYELKEEFDASEDLSPKKFCLECNNLSNNDIKKCNCGSISFIYGNHFQIKGDKILCDCNDGDFVLNETMEYESSVVCNYKCNKCENIIGTVAYDNNSTNLLNKSKKAK